MGRGRTVGRGAGDVGLGRSIGEELIVLEDLVLELLVLVVDELVLEAAEGSGAERPSRSRVSVISGSSPSSTRGASLHMLSRS